MRIYRLTDRVKIHIGEVTFEVSPLSYLQKMEIASHVKTEQGEDQTNAAKMAFLSLQYSIKAVHGLKYWDGEDFEISIESGQVTEACLSELLQVDGVDKLITACTLLMNEVKEHKISGARIEIPKASKKKKQTSGT